MKKVIISGCSGFIGSAIAMKLLEQGTEVYGLIAHPEKAERKMVESDLFHMIKCSFDDYDNLKDMIPAGEYDSFFHMAWEGYGKATNDYRVQIKNIYHTCEAAYAAASLGCKRFIFADSSHEYLTSVNENGEKGYCSIYGAAKKSAQQMCRVISHNAGMEYVGVLFTNIFGRGDRSSRSTNFFLRKLMHGEDLDLVEGNNLYDWTYIDDCVQGVLAAAQRGVAGKVYYVGSRQLRPFSEIIKQVRDIIAPNAKLNFGKYQDESYIDYTKINTYELYTDTGYLAKIPFSEGVKQCREWLNEIDAGKE